MAAWVARSGRYRTTGGRQTGEPPDVRSAVLGFVIPGDIIVSDKTYLSSCRKHNCAEQK
jgi:hypothetical protein